MTTDTKQTTMTIEKASSVSGNYGEQWELQVRFPWNTRFPDKVWLNKGDHPNEPAKITHNVLIRDRGAKKKQDGSFYDGSQDWMHNWEVVEFLQAGASEFPDTYTPQNTNAPVSVSTGTPQGNYDRDASIHLGQAFNLAHATVLKTLDTDMIMTGGSAFWERVVMQSRLAYAAMMEFRKDPIGASQQSPESTESEPSDQDGINARLEQGQPIFDWKRFGELKSKEGISDDDMRNMKFNWQGYVNTTPDATPESLLEIVKHRLVDEKLAE